MPDDSLFISQSFSAMPFISFPFVTGTVMCVSDIVTENKKDFEKIPGIHVIFPFS